MLDELSVSNLGVLRDVRVDLGAGLVVVTGETGAGKTLLLGALRLLLGEAARRDRIGPAGDALTVEARIEFDGNEHVLARRVTESGRSRAYLDGAMVTATALTETLGARAEVVGQHDHMALATSDGVRRLVDGALPDPGVLDEYASTWAALATLRQEMALLGGDRRALERDLETARFQADEIAAAGFGAEDETVLVETAERLRHHEAIVEHLAAAVAGLSEEGAGEGLGRAVDALRRAARLDTSIEPLSVQAEELATLAGELATSIAGLADDDERDPSQLVIVEERLALLGDLRRKYGASLEEVLQFGEAAEQRAADLERMLDRADRIAGDVDKAELRVAEAGERLRTMRTATCERLAAEATSHLRELGFADPVVRFVIAASEPGPTGTDRIVLEFASDASLTPGPVSRVASGGELSRLVLALRLAAGVADVPIVAFDEIDAGVGGATALALGRKLGALGEGRQVLCVTHLPQVAAFATTHVVVERDAGEATVRTVAGEARLEELSRMLAGTPDSLQGKAHAAELLAAAGRR
jgi:DNA repair protein RecN (Recombination protein N)